MTDMEKLNKWNAFIKWFWMVMACTFALLFFAAIWTTPVCSQEHPNGFKPLSRAEPVVRMVLQEAINEPFSGLVAVAGVALDRVEDRRWPNTPAGVVYQGNHSRRTAQFTGMSITLRDYSPDQITRARLAVASAEIGDRPCGRVLYYHTTWVTPKWDYTKIEVACQIGNHIFYRDKEK